MSFSIAARFMSIFSLCAHGSHRGDIDDHRLCMGIKNYTRAVVGYVVVCGVVKFPLLLWVYFFLPVSWVGSLCV